MPRYFGTDGVRGVALSELTVQMAETLGRAAVHILGSRLLIGRDTRSSGTQLQAGLIAGITAAGGEALLAGVIPTPAVAYLTRAYAANGGVVISASHNPPEYNGIKFFDAQGFKLDERSEQQFEDALQAQAIAAWEAGEASAISVTGEASVISAPGEACAANTSDYSIYGENLRTVTGAATAVEDLSDASECYIQHATQVFSSQGLDLVGLKIIVDCGHGAAFYTTPEALRRLGAELICLNCDFDGTDINVNSGSTHLEQLQASVLANAADLGFAHDGDADRVIAVDAQGNEVDGDFIEAICAVDLKTQGKLAHNTVVSTVMANFGFVKALREQGIEVALTDVGDSKVLAAMLGGGFTLGGEQSGHLIFLEHNSTGDGLVSALQLLAAMRRSGLALHELSQIMEKYPQEMINVTVSDKLKLSNSERLAAALLAAETELGSEGRVLLRPSGTEPKFRVMVEAHDALLAQRLARQLAELVAAIDSE
ncbi:MAG: phosphoglucosamine mutase [Coriobacteriales bacterium]|jgi:phosphoglucosamine mutase|nr:phosphoglucosamine mutase [Coriobacteriales bacterium]